jgi:hypothetical protein
MLVLVTFYGIWYIYIYWPIPCLDVARNGVYPPRKQNAMFRRKMMMNHGQSGCRLDQGEKLCFCFFLGSLVATLFHGKMERWRRFGYGSRSTLTPILDDFSPKNGKSDPEVVPWVLHFDHVNPNKPWLMNQCHYLQKVITAIEYQPELVHSTWVPHTIRVGLVSPVSPKGESTLVLASSHHGRTRKPWLNSGFNHEKRLW